MTVENLQNRIKYIQEANPDGIISYFVEWMPEDNIMEHLHGPWSKWESDLEYMISRKHTVHLHIKNIVFYCKTHANVYTSIHSDQEHDHYVYTNVSIIDSKGHFVDIQ